MGRRFCRRMAALHRDERGGEVLEWLIVSGLLIVTTFAVLGSVSKKILDLWDRLGQAW